MPKGFNPTGGINPKGNGIWKKGMKSPNPHGRPPASISHTVKVQEAFLEMLNRETGSKEKPSTFLNDYLQTFQRDAMKPGSKAYSFIASRLFGEDILEKIDAQLNKARRDDTAFQSFKFFREFHDVQQQVFLSKMRMKILNWGRRTGKTDYLVRQAGHDVTVTPGSQVIYFGPTFARAMDLFYKPLELLIKQDGLPIEKTDRANGEMHIVGGSDVFVSGASTSPDRNKWRGKKWDLAIVDECQNIPGLAELVLEILGPAMIDKNGVIILCGTGPKTRGTFWEILLSDLSRFKAYRSNANMSVNPFIPDHENVLAKVREEMGYSETDPIYLREYLGQIAYDDDALVFRMEERNYFTDEQLVNWIMNQSPEDLRFSAGLDYGFTDSDAFSIVLYSETKNDKFLVYEYKANNTDVTTLAEAVNAGMEYVKTSPLFAPIYHKDFKIYGDTSDQKIGLELKRRYGLPVTNALKQDKDFAVQMLQEEVRNGTFRIRKGGAFDDEALRIIFKRTDQDVLTREIDDEIFHPDEMDAILYSLRHYWLTHKVNHHVDTPDKVILNPNAEYWKQAETHMKSHDDQLF